MCQQGNVAAGLLWLARSLESVPPDDAELARVIRIVIARWYERICRAEALVSHPAWVSSVVFSPDGRNLATGGADDTVRIWNTENWRSLTTIKFGQPVNSVAYGDGSRVLATGCADGTARVWDATSGQPLSGVMRHPAGVTSVAWGRDGKALFTGCRDGLLRRWDVASGSITALGSRHSNFIYSIAVQPQGNLVMTGSEDRTARLWSALTCEPVGEPLQCRGGVFGVAFSPDGDSCATSSVFEVQLWDTATHKAIGKPLYHESWIWSVAFSPDGRRLLTGCRDGSARLWQVGNRASLSDPRPEATIRTPTSVRCVAFGPDGRRFVTASEEAMARVWRIPDRSHPLHSLPGMGPVTAAAFSPNGQTVVTGDTDVPFSFGSRGSAAVWDVATGRQLRKLPVAHAVRTIGFVNHDNLVWVGGYDGSASVWDVNTGQRIRELVVGPPPLNSIAAAEAGQLVVSGFGSLTRGEARLHDARGGNTPRDRILQQKQAVLAVAISPDRRLALTAGEDRIARLWDMATGEPVGSPMHHQNAIWTASFSPDGRSVLTGDWNGIAQVWDAADGTASGLTLHNAGPVTCAQYSSDGRMIATVTLDEAQKFWQFRDAPEGLLYLWDAASGTPLGPPIGHTGRGLWSVAISPDNTQVLTGSNDGTARIWAMPRPISGDLKTITNTLQLATNLELRAHQAEVPLTTSEWVAKRDTPGSRARGTIRRPEKINSPPARRMPVSYLVKQTRLWPHVSSIRRRPAMPRRFRSTRPITGRGIDSHASVSISEMLPDIGSSPVRCLTCSAIPGNRPVLGGVQKLSCSSLNPVRTWAPRPGLPTLAWNWIPGS